MKAAAFTIMITLAVTSLAALVHLQLAAWLFPTWVRSLYSPGGRYRTAGIVLQVLAWMAAATITGAGVAFMLSWMPSSWGSTSETGEFTTYAEELAWLAGLFMGSGWVWSLLNVARRPSA